MPKSTKHKKARVADFAKAKLKLGKGKQIANNATNTSFTTKTIPLPAQSLVAAGDATTPVSRRSLTLPTLLLQSHHYSPSVRSLALTEILLLLANHPALIPEHRLQIFGSVERGLEDPIQGIRASWRKVLKVLFDFEEQEGGGVGGSGGRLVLRTLSALSSLDEGIRIDGLHVLDMLLAKMPNEVVGGWTDGRVKEDDGESGGDDGPGAKVVESLLGVLRVRSKGLIIANGSYTMSSTSSDLTPSARLAVLRTLSTFLRAALYPSISSSTSSNPPWYLRPSYKTARAYSSFADSLSPSAPPQNAVYPLADAYTSIYPLNSLILPSANPVTLLSLSIQPRPTLLSILTPTLLSSFLDSAPTAFAPSLEGNENSTSEAHLATIISVISVARSLFWLELGGVRDLDAEAPGRDGERERTIKTLLSLLGHVGVYFPFEVGGEGGLVRSVEAEERILQVNLTFSSLVSLLPTSSATLGSGSRRPIPTNSKKARKAAEGDEKIDMLVSSVEEWVVSALKGEITTTRYPLGIPLSKEAYEDLEPTLWELLNRESLSRSSEGRVLGAVLDHFARSSTGETKASAFVFVARLILIQSDPAYIGRFEIRDGVKDTEPIGKWVLALPKYLWELGSKYSATTSGVISFLHRIAAQGSKGLFAPQVLTSLRRLLTPFFNLAHPTRGSVKGPFTTLPLAIKENSLDLVRLLLLDGREGEEEGRKLEESVRRALGFEGEEVRDRWEATGRRS